MKIEYADYSGFCEGVRHAVNIASKVKPPAYTLGPIVHNKRVVDTLEQRGIHSVTFEELQAKKGPIGSVIIRAHGIPSDQREWLRELEGKGRVRVLDATCSNIVRQYREAQEMKEQGYALWVVEERQNNGRTHPEIIAKLSRFGEGVYRITCSGDIPEGIYGKIALVPQTTFNRDEFSAIKRKLEPVTQSIRIVGDICNATHNRQMAAKDLAERVDAMVVVGGGLHGQQSNNTVELAKVSRMVNPNTYLVADASEINSDDFKGVETVGLTAGASTPDIVINEVADILERM